jgi:predicted DsbA family dithiol-disulfide isomerase
MVERDQEEAGVPVEDRVKFQIARVPFFLETSYFDMPDDFSEPHEVRMHRKFGGKEAFDQHAIRHALVPRGAVVGLDKLGFTEENLAKRRQSSTLRSHRLVYYLAKKYSFEVSEKLYSVLNRKHFTEGGILNDLDMLLDSVEEAGADRADCERFLLSTDGVESIFRTVDAVHSLGIHSIPTVVVDGKYQIGATDSIDNIYQVFSKIVRKGKPSGKRVFSHLMEF